MTTSRLTLIDHWNQASLFGKITVVVGGVNVAFLTGLAFATGGFGTFRDNGTLQELMQEMKTANPLPQMASYTAADGRVVEIQLPRPRPKDITAAQNTAAAAPVVTAQPNIPVQTQVQTAAPIMNAPAPVVEVARSGDDGAVILAGLGKLTQVLDHVDQAYPDAVSNGWYSTFGRVRTTLMEETRAALRSPSAAPFKVSPDLACRIFLLSGMALQRAAVFGIEDDSTRDTARVLEHAQKWVMAQRCNLWQGRQP